MENHKMDLEEIEYGPVFITRGANKGRIGYYDDDEYDEDERRFAVVYFGSMFLANGWREVPYRYLRRANTADLLVRGEAISKMIGIGRAKKLPAQKNYELLLEKHYIDSVLADNYLEARFSRGEGFDGICVFLSHSSKDKWFVRRLATDLVQLKIKPWLDEWEIRAGESIPQKIGQGLEHSQCVVLVLSGNSTASKWVEREWQSKYWDEVERNEVQVIPVLLADCEVPQLLKGKKYADFRKDYSEGLTELILAIPKKQS
jgi:hypothetical protein